MLAISQGSFFGLALVALVFTMIGSARSAETTIEAPGPIGPLKGVFLTPATKGSAEIALIIPGSGPTDRNGNGPFVRSSTYKLLANALAERGIASVRIDKRGLFSSAGAVANADAVTVADYVADIHTWIDAIRKRTHVSCVWLMGHSEGALIALASSAGEQQAICGLILIASPGRRIADILREQMKALSKTNQVLEQAMAAIGNLENGERYNTDGMHQALQPIFRDSVQDFLISLMSVDPVRLFAAYSGPALILQGDRDIQVTTEDAKRLKYANAASKLVLLPDTNHMLKSVTSDSLQANLATYNNPHLPLAPGVAESIAAFIQADR